MVTSADLAIKDLGPCRYPSPVAEKLGEKATVYVGDADKVLFDDRLSAVLEGASDPRPPAFELAGPRNRVFWDPRSPSDSVYCWNMARNAVHAAMAGNTEMLIGRWHGRFVHVPMPLAVRMRKQVGPTDDLWMAVVEAT
ncbi:hypothetical protein [Sorangium sp. So ce1335]|uniref:hypothetical protein n=1 Tax=Sorangium sp. So ce1335 TaxID=3133335 RepID=UPI003F5E84C0